MSLSNLIYYLPLDDAGPPYSDRNRSQATESSATITSANDGDFGGNVPTFVKASADYVELSWVEWVGDGSWWISLWAKRTASVAATARFFHQWEASGDNRNFYLDVNSAFKPRLTASTDGSSSAILMTHGTALAEATLTHVLVEHVNGVEVAISVNGARTATAHLTGIYNGKGVASGMAIGGVPGGAAASFWDGQLGRYAFGSGTLTADERTSLYNAGTPQATSWYCANLPAGMFAEAQLKTRAAAFFAPTGA